MQFIEELELVELDSDNCTIFIKVMNIEFDYDPLALRFYLEYCTDNKNPVCGMVVSADKKYVYATFNKPIGKHCLAKNFENVH
jgi:hypothetical protein